MKGYTMNVQEKLLAIQKIERVFPETARIMRSRINEKFHDQPSIVHQKHQRIFRRSSKDRLIVRRCVQNIRVKRLAAGLCRDCNERRSPASKNFCPEHLNRHKRNGRASFKRLYKRR